MKHKPHWYFQYFYICPVCGRTKIDRERRYTPKPDRWEDRIECHDDNTCANYDIL